MSPISIHDAVEEHLTKALASPQGRSAHTLVGGQDHVLRQTIIALKAGERLGEHEAPGEATLMVLRGRVSLGTSTGEQPVAAHELVEIPLERHDLTAHDDSVVLLTVAKAVGNPPQQP
jgi:quercetin dioxygenase-like cupin family protein